MRSKLTITFLLIFSLLTSARDSLWVQINIPVACIRDGKSHASEMTSQAIMGTPMQILEDDGGEWLKLRGPEGYEGYMNISSVARKDSLEMSDWRKSNRVTVTSFEEVAVYGDTLNLAPRNIVSQLGNGSILNGKKSGTDFTFVTLPDGRKGWMRSEALTDIEEWASQPFDAHAVLDRCYRLMGAPYLWGACSTKSVDCSGLVRVALYANGILTLRDARQQIEIGKRIEPDDRESLLPADLLFFSSTPDGRISHVAVYDNDGLYIHSSGRVKTNRMEESDPDFGNRVYRGASRIDGMTGTEGIWQIINHPWYF